MNINREHKYEYLLHCWGGFWNEHNIKIHKEPNFEYKWFNTKEERDQEVIRLKALAQSHGEYLNSKGKINDSIIAMRVSEGYLTRYQFVLQSLIMEDSKIRIIENNLGYGFYSVDEFDILGNTAEYIKVWKYEGNNDLKDNHMRLFTTLILR